MRGGGRGNYLQTIVGERSIKKIKIKKRGKGGLGKGRCISSENISYLGWRGGEAGGAGGGETGLLLTTAPGHFSGTFLQL